MTDGGKLPRLRSLDGLRGASVAAIIYFHAFAATSVAWISLELFFVLSGYLITRMLLQSRSLPLKEYLKVFFTNRSLRIFPLYFAYIAVLGAVYFIWQTPAGVGRNFPYLLTYTLNFTRPAHDFQVSTFFSHFWSLAVEEQFYVVWPFAVYLLTTQRLKGLCWGLLIFSPVARAVAAQLFNDGVRTPFDVGDSVYWMTTSQIDAMAVGAIIAMYQSRWAHRVEQYQRGSFLIFAVAGLANLVAIVQTRGWNYPTASSFGYLFVNIDQYQHVWSYSLIIVMWGFLLLRMVEDKENKWWLTRAMSKPLWVQMGQVSYGMYVFHWSIVYLVEKAFALSGWGGGAMSLPMQALRYVATVALTYGVAKLSFNYFESRFSKYRRQAQEPNVRPPELRAA